jgi:hypothetical protein
MTIKEGNIDAQLKKSGLIKGLFLGFIVLALNIFSYYFIITYIDLSMLVSISAYFFSLIVPGVITVFFLLNTRKKIGGYWSFKQAVTGIFIMFFTCYIVLSIGRDVLFVKLVEPNMVQKTEAAMIASKKIYDKQKGMSDDQIEKEAADTQTLFNQQKNNTIGAVIQGVATTTIMLFILAIIFAAIFKREPPLLPANETGA